MDGGSRRANAALAVATVLFGWALARGAPPPVDCPASSELRAEGGHSVALACHAAARGLPLRGPARLLVGLPIDPNLADAATLETLPGIGPARALAILATRARSPFHRVEEIARVPGIGPRLLAGMAGLVGIGEPPEAREERDLGPPRPDPVGCAAACGSPRPKGDS